MNLTKEQIQQIDKYISACGVKWYDVRVELVDHFANNLEKKLEDQPILNFKQAIVTEHRNFGIGGFKKLLESKTKEVEKRFHRSSLNYLVTFFRLPKIILSVVFFWGLTEIMLLFNNAEHFFRILTGVLLIITIQLLIRVKISRKKKGEEFLVLDKGDKLVSFFNLFFLAFNLITTLRTEKSFENHTYNYIQLSIFMLMVLYYISSEVICFKFKEETQSQYPDIKIAY